MPRILILYATIEGQTGRIAERIARLLRDGGHAVETQPAEAGESFLVPEHYDGVIVGASIHYGHHPAYLHALVERHRKALEVKPNAFFSVSLSAGGRRPKPAAARRYIDKFLRKTGWRPGQAASFAGALQFSKYGAFKRLLMIVFVGLGGGDTDTSRDYEYTDWDAVDRFAREFERRLGDGAAGGT